MKKILLCGATHGSNFGDSLFAYMFQSYVHNYNEDLDIFFTQASEYSRKNLKIKKASFKDLFSVEGLVFISGGYFGEAQYETFKGRIYHLVLYYVYGVFMAIRRKPIAIIGVGAGPLDSPFFRKLVMYIFKHAKVISLRDNESKDYMIKYGCKNNIIATSDSAQVIGNEFYTNDLKIPSVLSDESIKDKKKILVHITEAPGHELFEEKIISTLKETISEDEDVVFILTNDTIYDVGLNELMNRTFPKGRAIVYQYSDPFEFLGLLNSVDAIVTPKLHVAILGATYSKPVLSFPIHPEKTERYFKQIGYGHHCKSLYDVTKDEAKTMINNYLWEDVKLNDEIMSKAEQNFKLLESFLDQYVK